MYELSKLTNQQIEDKINDILMSSVEWSEIVRMYDYELNALIKEQIGRAAFTVITECDLCESTNFEKFNYCPKLPF